MKGAETFEDLRIWQQARALVSGVYHACGKGTLGEKDWGFKDQVQRAAVSIMNNIAEGFERTSPIEFARFLDIAKGSAGETRSLFYVAEDLGYLPADEASQFRGKARSISMGVAALAQHLRK